MNRVTPLSYGASIQPTLPNGNGGFTPCPALLTEDEAVRYLRLDGDRNPGRTLRYYRERGLLRATHLGRHLFYRLVELEEFLERLTAAKASR